MQYTAYEVIKWWLPICSAFGMVIAAWRSMKNNITEWVDKLLNNHLQHIEQNTADSVTALRETHQEFVTLRIEQAKSFAAVQDSYHQHAEMDARIQRAILTNLEVLKDRKSA